MRKNWFKGLFTLSLLTSLVFSSCQDERGVKATTSMEQETLSLMFAYSGSDEAYVKGEVLRSDHEWEKGSINQDESGRDQVNKIRIISRDLNLNKLIDLTNSETQKQSPKYILDVLKEDQEVTFYFIANENGSEGYGEESFDPEQSFVDTEQFFSGSQLPSHRLMVSKYSIKRTGAKYLYKRLYPFPHNDYREATTLTTTDKKTYLGVPVLLYPIYSRFTVTVELPEDYSLTREENGQIIKLNFEGFPKQKSLFSKATAGEQLERKTLNIDLNEHIEDTNSPTYIFYFPGTETEHQSVSLNYTFLTKTHSIKISPKETETFTLNTNYKLPIKVFVNRSYDIWIEDIYTIRLESLDEVTNGNGGDFEIIDDKKKGLIHVGVSHNYRTMLKIKSRLKPAKVVIPEDSGIHWILAEKEVEELREIEFDEDGFPNYIQYFPLKYRVDYIGQEDPLIAEFKYVNTGDTEKEVDFVAAFNIISRFAKVNLGMPNKFVNGEATEENLTPEDLKKHGAIYQYGRNAPIQPTEGVPKLVKDVPVTLDDPVIWSSQLPNGYYKAIAIEERATPAIQVTNPTDLDSLKVLSGIEEDITQFDIYSWFKFPGDRPYRIAVPDDFTSWSKMVLKQKELAEKAGHKVPEWYVGNNNGDPCPPGYQVPTMYDVSVIFYNKEEQAYFKQGNYMNGKSKTVNVAKAINTKRVYTGEEFMEDNLNPSGDPKSETLMKQKKFETRYYRINNNLVYARRFMGSQFESLFRYENQTDGVTITCFPLRKRYMNKSVNELTSDAFWQQEDNKWLQEELFIPDSYGSFVVNIKVTKYSNPDIWTSTSLPAMSAMDIDFNFSSSDNYKYSAPIRVLLPIRCIRI